MNDLTDAYAVDWAHFQTQIQNHTFPQTFLLQASPEAEGLNFARRLAASLLCTNPAPPCGYCQSCDLLQLGEHPDFFELSPAKVESVIKIDQIRMVQASAYLTPQLNHQRIILIHPAEKLNLASANALLKLLEEPPAHLNSILVASSIRGLPSTLLSRCHSWTLSPRRDISNIYQYIAQAYSPEHPRGKLMGQSLTLLQDLDQLLLQQSSVFDLALKWGKHPFSDFIWLLHLMQTALIRNRWINNNIDNINNLGTTGENLLPEPWRPLLHTIASSYTPHTLFKQLEAIHQIQKNLSEHIHLNQQLVLESLFLNYVDDIHK